LRGVGVVVQTTTNSRRDDMLRRAGKDPIEYDRRPLNIIMNDEIPEARWEREFEIVKRAGFESLVEMLRAKIRGKASKQ
jgi:hypothetical protein